jgi:anthranilate phosphoribosyltransferase
MAIAQYIKEIGRGKEGARPLSREQANDAFSQILDSTVSDMEIGAFCLAMRIKGETQQEMAGFLDAIHQRLERIPQVGGTVTAVIPSYNGARKLPLLTPLLALLLAREGFPVVVHGVATESTRVFTSDVFAALGCPPRDRIEGVKPGNAAFFPTALLCQGLQRLLDVRKVVGLRNSAHSLVKLMLPVEGPSILITSYTHPEYAVSMSGTLELMQSTALLLRGTEGEAVADPRRTPKFQAFLHGKTLVHQEQQTGSLLELPDLPHAIDAKTTAGYIQSVLNGDFPVPEPIKQQVALVLQIAANGNT